MLISSSRIIIMSGADKGEKMIPLPAYCVMNRVSGLLWLTGGGARARAGARLLRLRLVQEAKTESARAVFPKCIHC